MTTEILSCPYCNTHWIFETQAFGDKTGWSGFLVARINHHKWRCADKTPEERLKWIRKAKIRQDRKPAEHSTMRWNVD